ncbi:MAG: hypothetical protein PVH61_40555 [Candidatus Aminicenantes bacterium]|jgi:hypothetical protein
MTTKKREFKVTFTPVKKTMKMKRLPIILVITVMFMFLTPIMAAAQDTGARNEIHLFTWLTGETPDWSTGILYAIMGFVGALVTVFGLIGGAVPGTGGFTRIKANLQRLEEREKKVDELINDPQKDPEFLEKVEKATNNLRDDLRVDRRNQFMLASVLYAFLGAFFAALLAKDIIQAMVIGAGWTGLIGALGLKRDYRERKQMKDAITTKMEKALFRPTKNNIEESYMNDLKMEINVSKAI